MLAILDSSDVNRQPRGFNQLHTVDGRLQCTMHYNTNRSKANGGGGGGLPEKLGRGVRPASQNPYPIYDQNLRYSLPYL